MVRVASLLQGSTRPSSLRHFVSATAVCIAMSILLLIWSGRSRQLRMDRTAVKASSHSVAWKDAVVPCTFAQLQDEFGSSSPRRKSSCWSLKEEILRIPTTSIANFHTMEALGEGLAGSVHKAVIQLSNRFCTVAMKSDKPGTKRRVGAEYTGALLFYSSLFYENTSNNPHPRRASLPTWGVVVQEESFTPLRWWKWMVSRLCEQPLGSLHSDPTVFGVFMPLIKFRQAKEVHLEYQASGKRISPPQTCRLAKSAVGSYVQFLHLGMVHQDINHHNIAYLVGEHGELESAFLYDNSFAAVIRRPNDNPNCHTDDHSCQFCWEDEFAAALKKYGKKPNRPASHKYGEGIFHQTFEEDFDFLCGVLLKMVNSLCDGMLCSDIRRGIENADDAAKLSAFLDEESVCRGT